MGKGIRWVFTIIAAAFLTALIQPPLERMLENAGWYESPYHAAGKIVNWIEQIVGVQAFPWMAGVALGLAAGVWLDPLLKRLDGTHPLTKRDKAKRLALDVKYKGSEILIALGKPGYRSSYERLVMEGIALAKEVERLGVPLPSVEPNAEIEEKMFRLGKHLELIAPVLAYGDLKSAKMIAATREAQAAEGTLR